MKSDQRLYYAAGDDTEHVEDREKYRPGGYHPIHFDDYLDSNKRFQVVHKLGWGASSTVWLCYDEKCRYYRSVKVMTSEESVEECQELQITKALADVSYKELKDNYIAIPREHFWIEGPNGRHLCFVSDLLGPSLFQNSPDGMGIHTPDSLTDLTFQVSKGLQYLHNKGICHGDLRPSNILMRLNKYSVMELTDRQLNRYLGPRQYQPLETLSGKDPKPHGPDYLAFPVSLDKLEKKCRTGKVAIVDFGDSFQCLNPPSFPRWHRQYAGPELLFTESLGGLPQDIWALACTIYEIKLQTQLFSEYEDHTSLIRQMEVWFGPLPAEYRKLARTHLERDKERRLASNDKKASPSNTPPLTEDQASDLSQPISLSPDEERRMRKMFVGKSDWSNPLQASLGKERHCYAYERNNEEYTSSDDTDFDSESLHSHGSDQVSEDDDFQEDIYAEADIIFGEAEHEEDLISEGSDEEAERKTGLPLPRTSQSPEDPEEKSEDNRQLAMPTSTEVGAAPHDPGSNASGAGTVGSPSSPQDLLGKRDANESMPGRGTKRQRTRGPPTEEKGDLVERVISMPREEVLLLSDLLLRMFKHDPKERIDIDTVVNHDFWGDRRNNLPTNSSDFIEPNPDAISSRTRSRTSNIKQETEIGSPKEANR
ncbi:kinase-like domain-containing protein [Hypoxylon sp. FL0890]|nr:kinase-like domain-containing protein [Hypoxylon sp. FL0890]